MNEMSEESLKELINTFWTYDSKTQIEFKNYIYDLFGCMGLMADIGDIIEKRNE